MFNIFQNMLKMFLIKDIGYNYDEDWLYNQIMIKKLKAQRKLRNSNIIEAFETINKAWFMPSKNDECDSDIDDEYKYTSADLSIHLFSPSVYATILENLDLQQEHSFLNIGSGTGYLSSICGCLIGK
uniref:Protein-L-isoaspartate O-methyltransferase n=1 Tax=Panagrolaimus sp. PS1159 TaxID=55785 RepID=A0AC35FCB7_9BILA